MFRRIFLGFVSAIMLIATVVLSGCGASDPMLGKWIAPIPGNSQLGALMVNIEKNGDDQKTRVVTVSTYAYENKSTYDNRDKGELLMVWQKTENSESRAILPCSNNIIQLPLGTIAYDQNRKCLISDGIELKKADEKGVKEAQVIIQKKVNDIFVGNNVTMPDNKWNRASAYLVKTVIFKDAAAK